MVMVIIPPIVLQRYVFNRCLSIHRYRTSTVLALSFFPNDCLLLNPTFEVSTDPQSTPLSGPSRTMDPMLAILLMTCVAWTTFKLLLIGRRDKSLPPGPPTIPVLGNMHLLPLKFPFLKYVIGWTLLCLRWTVFRSL